MSSWYPYMTRVKHLIYEAGTPCEVRISQTRSDLAEVRFSDGKTIGLLLTHWYFPGVPGMERRQSSVIDQICAIEDARCSAALEQAASMLEGSDPLQSDPL